MLIHYELLVQWRLRKFTSTLCLLLGQIKFVDKSPVQSSVEMKVFCGEIFKNNLHLQINCIFNFRRHQNTISSLLYTIWPSWSCNIDIPSYRKHAIFFGNFRLSYHFRTRKIFTNLSKFEEDCIVITQQDYHKIQANYYFLQERKKITTQSVE